MASLSLYHVRVLLILTLAASLTVSAVRIARLAKARGRNPYAWFFISLFLTAIPATIVFWRERVREISPRPGGREQPPLPPSSPPPRRCPHCGWTFDAPDTLTGRPTCPKCRMSLNEGNLA